MRSLLAISAQNYRSLRRAAVTLRPLNVLVGPNQAGKSNFLDLIEFLGDSARNDLQGALEERGGFDRVRFRGSRDSGAVVIHVSANVTTHSHEGAPDEYRLSFWTRKLRNSARRILMRDEHFTFKRTKGGGRRITVSGTKAEFMETTGGTTHPERQLPLGRDSLALSTLRRLPKGQGGEEIDRMARLFTTFRVFNPDVEAARAPARIRMDESIRPDASNLSSAIMQLVSDEDRYEDFLDDARAMIPGFETIDFETIGGSSPAVAIRIVEKGLQDPTYLADASFGTVRILALLSLLYDPEPPQLTCIEEIDHGIHPYVFDRLVERLREASSRTQILVATHSPALVNRLRADELLVCERQRDGATIIPAVDSTDIKAKEDAVQGRLSLGEIWFSGTLGGVPR